MPTKATQDLVVKDVMSRNPVCVGLATSLAELAEILDGNDISGVPVVDAQDRILGVVSKSDLVHRCLAGPIRADAGSFFSALAEGLTGGTELDPEELGSVEDFMSPDPVIATVDESIGSIARRMAKERVHRVVVVDNSQCPIGVVTTLDLLKVFAA